MAVVIIIPAEAAGGLPEILPAARVVAYGDLHQALDALRDGSEPAVLWSDALPAEWLEVVADVVCHRAAPVVEVRSERWDGQTPSPLSAVCRGVISGFGVAGVRAAAQLLGQAAR